MSWIDAKHSSLLLFYIRVQINLQFFYSLCLILAFLFICSPASDGGKSKSTYLVRPAQRSSQLPPSTVASRRFSWVPLLLTMLAGRCRRYLWMMFVGWLVSALLVDDVDGYCWLSRTWWQLAVGREQEHSGLRFPHIRRLPLLSTAQLDRGLFVRTLPP